MMPLLATSPPEREFRWRCVLEKALRTAVIPVLAFVATGCGSGAEPAPASPPPNVPTPVAKRLIFSPDTVRLMEGDTSRVEVRGLDESGASVPLVGVEWKNGVDALGHVALLSVGSNVAQRTVLALGETSRPVGVAVTYKALTAILPMVVSRRSLDGKLVLTTNSQKTDLDLLDLRTRIRGHWQRSSTGPATGRPCKPANASPDGQRFVTECIAFGDAVSELVLADSGLGNLRTLVWSDASDPTNNRGGGFKAWAPDSRRFWAIIGAIPPEVTKPGVKNRIYSRDGTLERTVDMSSLGASPDSDYSLSFAGWSPDGSKTAGSFVACGIAASTKQRCRNSVVVGGAMFESPHIVISSPEYGLDENAGDYRLGALTPYLWLDNQHLLIARWLSGNACLPGSGVYTSNKAYEVLDVRGTGALTLGPPGISYVRASRSGQSLIFSRFEACSRRDDNGYLVLKASDGTVVRTIGGATETRTGPLGCDYIMEIDPADRYVASLCSWGAEIAAGLDPRASYITLLPLDGGHGPILLPVDPHDISALEWR